MSGMVYLINAVGTNRYKIGRSRDPSKRLAELQTGSPFPLELVASVYADNAHSYERYLHDHFKHMRRHGEWFELEDKWLRKLPKGLKPSRLVAAKTEKGPQQEFAPGDICYSSPGDARWFELEVVRPAFVGALLVEHTRSGSWGSGEVIQHGRGGQYLIPARYVWKTAAQAVRNHGKQRDA